MEWTIVEVLVVLVGLFLTIGKPLLQFSNKVQVIIDRVDAQQKELGSQDKTIAEHTQTLQKHEIRIHDLETKND